MTNPTHTPGELKACACCGSAAKFEAQRFCHPPKHWVKCTNCGMSSDAYSSKDSARLAWNQRTVDTELLEALRRIDQHVSHALMGDWQIALREIRNAARAAITKAEAGS